MRPIVITSKRFVTDEDNETVTMATYETFDADSQRDIILSRVAGLFDGALPITLDGAHITISFND